MIRNIRSEEISQSNLNYLEIQFDNITFLLRQTTIKYKLFQEFGHWTVILNFEWRT